jgi:Cdc6-like AAA superfamily ATPase
MLRMNTPLSIPKSNHVASPAAFFVNRKDEINTIVNILRGGESSPATEKRCVIRGNSGTGKTELCCAVAHQLLQEYSDAQIYLNLRDDESTDISLYKTFEAITHIFDPLAQISDDMDLLYDQYFSVLNGKKVLIILDDLPSF